MEKKRIAKDNRAYGYEVSVKLAEFFQKELLLMQKLSTTISAVIPVFQAPQPRKAYYRKANKYQQRISLENVRKITNREIEHISTVPTISTAYYIYN